MGQGAPRRVPEPDRVDFESRADVPLDELFTDAFMKRHTPWETFDQMLHQAEREHLEGHPEGQGTDVPVRRALTDDFVTEHTKFGSFAKMARLAGIEWIQDEMKKGADRFHGGA